MSYLTTQYRVHENLFCAVFNNVTLADADEDAEDSGNQYFCDGDSYPGHLGDGGHYIWYARQWP